MTSSPVNSGSSAGVPGSESTGPDEGTRPPAEVPEAREIAALLRAYLAMLNETDPADYDVPWMLHNFRHACDAARIAKVTGRAVSTALECRERYVTLGDALTLGGVLPPPDVPESLLHAWAIIYREGTCARCHRRARSKQGHVVATATRPPLEGRVAR